MIKNALTFILITVLTCLSCIPIQFSIYANYLIGAIFIGTGIKMLLDVINNKHTMKQTEIILNMGYIWYTLFLMFTFGLTVPTFILMTGNTLKGNILIISVVCITIIMLYESIILISNIKSKSKFYKEREFSSEEDLLKEIKKLKFNMLTTVGIFVIGYVPVAMLSTYLIYNYKIVFIVLNIFILLTGIYIIGSLIAETKSLKSKLPEESNQLKVNKSILLVPCAILYLPLIYVCIGLYSWY